MHPTLQCEYHDRFGAAVSEPVDVRYSGASASVDETPRVTGSPSVDLNARIAGLLGDLAAIQTIRPKALAYRHAAATVFSLPAQLDRLRANGPLPKIAGIGPSSQRVIDE